MRQIGFKNFRKFQDFPTIDLAPITLFVGENNAGKSTVVKAILALLDFLNSGVANSGFNDRNTSILNQQFYFNKSYFTHIGTFQRALNNKAEEDKITFDIAFDHYKFVIEVMGDRGDEEAISGRISRLLVTLLEYNIDFDFDFRQDNIHATFHHSENPLWDVKRISQLKVQQEQERKILKKYYDSFNTDIEFDMPISGMEGYSAGNNIGSLYSIALAKINATIMANKGGDKQPLFAYAQQIAVEGLSEEVLQFLTKNNRLFDRLGTMNSFTLHTDFSDAAVEYIYAHAVTQTVIYSAKDINDYFVRTIHDFANQRVLPDTPIHTFIVKWMKEFKIGADYEINSVGGEAHIVKIKSNDGTEVNLADKGMGSIQLMILLFRLATKMAQSGVGFGGQLQSSTIIVEEPEQNLHPMLQSKLADLFYSINQDYGFRIIIETHSEYLIRRSQVIVGEKYDTPEKLVDNPFKVFYFPTDGVPYDMVYGTSGMFKEKFGEGFFNEAGKLHMQVLQNAKKGE